MSRQILEPVARADDAPTASNVASDLPDEGDTPERVPDTPVAAPAASTVSPDASDVVVATPPVVPSKVPAAFPVLDPPRDHLPAPDSDDDSMIGSGLPAAATPAQAIVCPNCRESLDHRPKSRSACPHCTRTIHIRARQSIFRSGLVGEDDVDAIDFLERVEPFGIDERTCLDGMRDRSLAEVVWQLCEDRLHEIPTRRQAQLLNEMAECMRWRGLDPGPLRLRAETAALLSLKERGIEKVAIVTRGDAACARCAARSGEVFPIDDALEKLPLPVTDCTSSGVCRCAYGEVV
ncbi:MAG: hypothetical protein ACE5IK_11700 [Acidobacteriota bacterium]